MTQEEAIKIGKSGIYKTWTHEEKVDTQLYNEYICMPVGDFLESLTVVFKRPVYDIELLDGGENLKAELEGRKSPPTIDEIVNMFPGDKIIVVITE